jgi:hypothetical protein
MQPLWQSMASPSSRAQVMPGRQSGLPQVFWQKRPQVPSPHAEQPMRRPEPCVQMAVPSQPVESHSLSQAAPQK